MYHMKSADFAFIQTAEKRICFSKLRSNKTNFQDIQM